MNARGLLPHADRSLSHRHLTRLQTPAAIRAELRRRPAPRCQRHVQRSSGSPPASASDGGRPCRCRTPICRSLRSSLALLSGFAGLLVRGGSSVTACKPLAPCLAASFAPFRDGVPL